MASILLLVLLVALVSISMNLGSAAFGRGAAQWPGFVDRRVERVRVGAGAFRDQSVQREEDRVVPPGMPGALKAAAIAGLVVGSPVFVLAAVVFSVISARVFLASVSLGGTEIVRGAAMLAGALLWLLATVASWRGASATVERETDAALRSLRFASIAQLLSMLSLAYVAITKYGLQRMSLIEWLVVAWPLIALVPMSVAWRTVSAFAGEMRGHGAGVVVTEGGVRVDPASGREGEAPPREAEASASEAQRARR